MQRGGAYFVQFSARTNGNTGMPEVVCSKVSGAKHDSERRYDPQEKHPVNINLTWEGPGSVTLYKIQHSFWVHRKSLCMHIEADGEISYAPMLMEFVETNVQTQNPRSLHLLRITSWPPYMNHSLNLQGKFKKNDDTGNWEAYRTLATGSLPGTLAETLGSHYNPHNFKPYTSTRIQTLYKSRYKQLQST